MTKRPVCIVACTQPAPEWCWIAGGVRALLHRHLTGDPEPDSAGAVIWTLPSGPIVVLTIQSAYPSTGLQDDLAQRTAWPGWQDAVRAWQSHYVVTRFDIDPAVNPRAAAADILRVGSAIARITRAHGLCWSGAGVVHPAPAALERLFHDPLHPDVTVRCLWTQADGRNGARTRGLDALGLPELEVPATAQPVEAIHARLMNTARHLIQTGPVLETVPTEPDPPEPRKTAESYPIHLVRPTSPRTFH